MVEETWLVLNDKVSRGGDRNKPMCWQWLSSSGRMDESSVALRQKLTRVTMRSGTLFCRVIRVGWSAAGQRHFPLAQTIIHLLLV